MFSEDVDTALAIPSLNAVDVGSASATGTVPNATDGTVQLCDDKGNSMGAPGTVGAGGIFTVTLTNKATSGQKIQAQFKSKEGKFSTASTPGLVVGSCSALASTTGTAPTLNVSDINNVATFSGTVKGATSGRVRICVGDLPNGKSATIDTDGRFDGSTSGFSVSANDKIVAQTCTGDACSAPYGPLSDVAPLSTGPVATGCQTDPFYYSCGFASFIGGVEWAGFSSQTITTNGFLSATLRSRYVRWHKADATNPSPFGTALWGRVRLLSAPQPSSNGISFASTLADPTGSITTTQLANVGQAVDYVLGFEERLHQWDDTTICTVKNADKDTHKCNGTVNLGEITSKSASRISFIIAGGATTTLPSNTVVSTFNAPAVNSPECQEFINRYPPSPGVAGVYKNTNTNPTTCLMNPLDTTNSDMKSANGHPISYVSFTNPDRTNFYPKYGAGFRFTRVFAPTGPNSKPYSGSVDFTIGQDQSMSGGRWWGPVLRVDGVYPIAFGASSLFYVFGSAAMRTGDNKTYPPLILTTPASGSSPTVPGPDVTVLSL